MAVSGKRWVGPLIYKKNENCLMVLIVSVFKIGSLLKKIKLKVIKRKNNALNLQKKFKLIFK